MIENTLLPLILVTTPSRAQSTTVKGSKIREFRLNQEAMPEAAEVTEA